MRIRNIILSAVLALSGSCYCLMAQDLPSTDSFRSRYNKLVETVGISGVGVKGIIDKWEAAYPDDVEALSARFLYDFDKSQRTEVVAKDVSRFLGAAPVLSLKDSTGAPVNYFQETFYDDDLFSSAIKAVDRAIQLDPQRLDFRFARITALMAYEKDSPDMATSDIMDLIEYNYKKKPQWMYPGVQLDETFFHDAVQEYCYTFFRTATPASYQAFHDISTKMLSYNAKDVVFINNIGSYYQVVKKDNKTALKYYNKALKLQKDDLTAIQNCILLARQNNDVKMEKKYLEMMVRYAPDSNEKLSAQTRLNALSAKTK